MQEIATVYARSLFEVSRDAGTLDVVREQIGQVADALEGDRRLTVFFFSPYFSTEEKVDGLRRMIVDADPAVLNFLTLLVENHRMPALFRIRRDLDQLWERENQLLPVRVTSAVELDQRVLDSISERIGDQTGRRVQLSATVDPEILGGLVLRVGNRVLDASIRNRLERLRRQVARAV